jgi:hypothetical protein
MPIWSRTAVAALLLSGPLSAHVISMSSGELKVQDRSATFELRMPAYEIQHVTNPQTALLDQMKFEGGKRTSSQCKLDEDVYACTATYEFAEPLPDKLDVECTLFKVTVPNHVHLLHAVQGSNADQVVFDNRFTNVEVRFHPPSPLEVFVREAGGGIARLFTSVSGLLFIAALAIAAKSWKDAVLLTAVFLIGEWIARPLAPRVPLALSPSFLDAAMALTAAYLAVDVLLLPEGRSRWAIVPILGLVHGFAYASFPANYLTGAAMVQVGLVAALTALLLRAPAGVRKTSLMIVIVASLGWFVRLLFA